MKYLYKRRELVFALQSETLEDGAFANLEQARPWTFAYVEGYYIRTGRHSGLAI